MRTWASPVVSIAVVITLIGAMWAKQQNQKPQSLAGSEHRRCAKTCSVVTDEFSNSYPKAEAREGDKQCWDTCWTRMGKGERASPSDVKKLWQENMPSHLRVNQCAQACWRKRHDGDKTVSVGGWKSEPRKTACR